MSLLSRGRPCLLLLGCLSISDLGEVLEAVWEARSKWYNVGLSLRISPDTLDTIQRDHRDISENCFMAMLKVWLRRTQPHPTWAALARAMRSPMVGYGQLAEEFPV